MGAAVGRRCARDGMLLENEWVCKLGLFFFVGYDTMNLFARMALAKEI